MNILILTTSKDKVFGYASMQMYAYLISQSLICIEKCKSLKKVELKKIILGISAISWQRLIVISFI